jgi:bifunctional non-homologous end joining protein LigD
VGLPSSIVTSAQNLGENCILDGECVADVLFVFDLLSRKENSLLTHPYQARWHALVDLLDYSEHLHIELLETAFETEEKKTFLETFRRQHREGVVFKRLDSPYTPGQRNRTQLKHKFYATLSAVVKQLNARRSVELMLFDGQTTVPAGNVTIPETQSMPQPGAVVEVRYLYAHRESGALYQPVYRGPRTDTFPEECQVSQLKFKPVEEDEP